MATHNNLLKFLLLVMLGLVVALLVHRLFLKPLQRNTGLNNEPFIPHPIETTDRLPQFTLLDQHGNPQSSSQWLGKVLVLNFWATWCPPCRKEIPGFIALQNELETQGLQFVGIAIDDPADVRHFISNIALNYPVLIGDSRALQLSERLGNRLQGLPFTVLFDRNGNIVGKTTGELAIETIRAKIKLLLK